MTSPSPGGNKAFITSYCGAALHPDTADLYVIGGGHADYAGNDVYKLNLNSETPTWTMLRAPSPSSAIQADNQSATVPGYAYYLDGSPTSRHTWENIKVVPERNRVFLFTAGAVWGNGNGTFPVVDAFNLATNSYDASGTYASAPLAQAGMMTVRDGAGNVWISTNGSNIYKWTQATATWQFMGSANVYDRHGGALYDSLRDRVVKLPDTQSQGRYWSATGALGLTYFSMTGAITSAASATAVYEPVLDRYLLFPKGTTAVYSVHPTTFVSSLVTTTGTAYSLPGTDGEQTMGGRISYVSQLGGVVVVPSASLPIKFIRTH